MFSHRKSHLAILLGFVVLLSLYGTAAAQASGFQIKIDQILTNKFPEVQLNLSILNTQGFPITGLTSEDITLKEDGKDIEGFNISTFSNNEEPLAIAILVDTSGSMKAVGDQDPLGDAVEAASAFINQLSADDYVAVISFADDVTLLQNLTADKSNASSNLRSLKADGATAMNDAVVTALNLLTDRSERRAIVLITDGRPQGDQKYDFNNALSLAAARSIPIYPIGFGDVNEDQLQKLAEMSGGVAQIKPGSQELSDALSSILALFRQKYSLTYISSLTEDDASHQVEVLLNYQGESQSAFINYVARNPINVEILQPTAENVIKDQVEIQVSVDALNPVSQVEIYIDDVLMQTFSQAPYLYNWNASDGIAGAHTIRVVAKDTLGFEDVKVLNAVVELPSNEWMYWAIGLVVLVVAAISIPLILRSRTKKTTENIQKAVLVETGGLQLGMEWDLDKNIIRLGRKMAENDIRLKGIDASRNHAVIERSKTGFCIRSLKPENPVIVNGENVEQRILQPGDVIQMGESFFRFEYRD
ncbi:MAG: VWA domain-containing protein [Anaerolineaceae bacterium]